MRFRTPGTFLKKKNLVGKKNSEIFRPPPPQKKKIIFYFLGVLRHQEHFLAEIFFSVKNSHLPPPTCTLPPSPQNTHPISSQQFQYDIQTITTNTSNKYTMSVMYTSSSLPVNVHTISNPITLFLYAADIIYKMSNRLVYQEIWSAIELYIAMDQL